MLTLDSSIDVTTGTIRMKATFPNADDALWPGQFVNVRMQLDLRRGAVTVPTAAVQRGVNGLFAYVVRDGAATVQPIEVAQDDGRMAVVTKGLTAGEQVVVAGQSRLAPGIKVAATQQKPAS